MKHLLILIVLWCCINSTGEILIKLGTRSLITPQNTQEVLLWIGEVIQNPLILFGVAISAIDLLLWIFILKSGDLSVVVPLTSLNYIFAIAVGCIIFHENFTLSRMVGILLICGGAYFVSR
ncbi:MAG: EamA family transporter [Veillonellales bacterium]